MAGNELGSYLNSESGTLAETAVTYLYGGLNEAEQRAVCIVNQYLEACDRRCRSDAKSCASIAEILSWTSFYHRKEKLAAVCVEAVSPSAIDRTPQSIDWFRVVCCLLDQKRLENARELVQEHHKSRRHSSSTSSVDATKNVDEVRAEDEASDFHCGASADGQNGLRKKRKCDTAAPTPYDSDSNAVLPSPGRTQMMSVDTCASSAEHVVESDFVAEAHNSYTQQFSNVGEQDCDSGVLDKENVATATDDLPSCARSNGSISRNSVTDESLVLLKCPPGGSDCSGCSTSFTNETRLLCQFVHHWAFTVAESMTDQLIISTDNETLDSTAPTAEVIAPCSLSCARLVAIYKHVLELLSWVLNAPQPQQTEQGGLSCGTKPKGQMSSHGGFLGCPVKTYVDQVEAFEKVVGRLFLKPCITQQYTSKQYDGGEKEEDESIARCTPSANLTAMVLCESPAALTPDVFKDSPKVENNGLWRLQGDTVVRQAGQMYKLYTESQTAVKRRGWSNPKFSACVLQNHSKHLRLHIPRLCFFQTELSNFYGESVGYEPYEEAFDGSSRSYGTEKNDCLTVRDYEAYMNFYNGTLNETDANSDAVVVFPRIQAPKPFVFIAGVLSMVWDIVVEFWMRVRNVATRLLHPSTTDVLREIRLLSQTLVICNNKPGTLLQPPEMSRVFNQLEVLLTNDCVPSDLVDFATRAWDSVVDAQREWERIQQENVAKKKAAEEAEALNRRIAAQEAVKREHQRRSAVVYVKAALAREAHYNVSNPFWLLGVPPKIASVALLTKIKRKLSLLLHPDKCLDSALKADAQLAFTAITNAISTAQELIAHGTHLLCIPPGERPPFADEVGIPEFDSVSRHPTGSIPKRPTAAPFTSSGADASPTAAKPSAGGKPAAAQEPASSNRFRSEGKIECWSSGEFSTLLESKTEWIIGTQPPTSGAPPAPTFATHSATKGQIWVTIPDEAHWYIRLFISRPWLQPSPGDPTAESHEAEDGIAFLVPKTATQALKKAVSPLAATDHQRCAGTLSPFSAIVYVRTSSFNLTEWTSIRKEMIQPVMEEKRRKSSIYIAAQTVDSFRRTVSKTVWTSLPPRRFALPPTKPKIIKMIQLFNNAPKSYRVLDVIHQHVGLTEDKKVYEGFPPVKVMTGWTYSTLSSILSGLIEAAADTTV